jgi:hypothetical protein
MTAVASEDLLYMVVPVKFILMMFGYSCSANALFIFYNLVLVCMYRSSLNS